MPDLLSDSLPGPLSSTLSSPLIAIEHLSFTYPGAERPSLCDINLAIPAGQIFGVLGPNGAGKSTLLSIMAGILPLQDGRVVIDGCVLSHAAKAIKERSAIVPQDYAFYEQLSARENLAFFSGLLFADKVVRAERIDSCLAACQLESVQHKKAGHFSGGLKRRLNLAIGLLGNPKILYLDEPTVGIDAQSRQFILEKILELKRAGMTILYTSHYFEEVEKLCDGVVIIDQGVVIFSRAHREQGVGLEQQYLQLTGRLGEARC